MSRERNWNKRYITGDLPWDTGKHDFNLSEIITKRHIRPCKVLEFGCGTGSNAIWLSRQGFSATAVDITEIAIQRAIKKASEAGVKCKFYVRDFMKQKIAGAPFSFVFDRGCFHSFDLARERSKYAKIAQGLGLLNAETHENWKIGQFLVSMIASPVMLLLFSYIFIATRQ